MKKRVLLSSLLFVVALCLVVSAMAKPVSAAEIASGTCGENITWVLNDGGVLTVNGTGPMYDYTTHEAKPWLNYQNSIRSIVVSEGITNVGAYSFSHLYYLTKVVIPDSVSEIGASAFETCSALTDVILGNGITTIGDFAFAYCNSMNFPILPKSLTTIGKMCFYQNYIFAYIDIPANVTSIGTQAFGRCGNVARFSVDPNNPYYSADEAGVLFNKNKTVLLQAPYSLDKGYIIPNSVVTIGDGAFSSCYSLAHFSIPEGVISIGRNAFELCYALSSIGIPTSVKSIGENAFSELGFVLYNGDQTQWNGITIAEDNAVLFDAMLLLEAGQINPDSFGFCGQKITWQLDEGTLTLSGSGPMEELGHTEREYPWAKSYKAITKIVIGEGITYIGKYAFYGFRSLREISVAPNNQHFSSHDNVLFNKDKTSILLVPMTRIGTYTIPDGVTTIGLCAFSCCGDLTDIIFPDSLITISDKAFEHCTSLTSLDLGNSITTIGNEAFFDCYNLTSVYLRNGITSIGMSAFGSCGLTEVTIPNTLTTLSHGVFSHTELTNVIIPEGITYIGYDAFRGCPLTEVTIPNTVTTIGWGAFEECRSLISITIPGSVTTIEDFAFCYCTSLTNVLILDGVTTIGNDAFAHNYSLTNVTIPSSVTTIGERAFYYCWNLTSVMDPDNILPPEEVTVYSDSETLDSMCVYDYDTAILLNSPRTEGANIPEGVDTIGDFAFEGCNNLSVVTISSSVSDIGEGVFSNCSSVTGIHADPDNQDYASDDAGVLYNKDKTALIQAPGALDGCYYISARVSEISKSALSGCNTVAGYRVDANNHYFSSDAYGVLFNKDKTTLIKAPRSLQGIYTIPKSVTTIANSAFDFCMDLTGICIQEGVTTIGKNAFYNCYLTWLYYGGNESQWNQISIGEYNEALFSVEQMHFNTTISQMIRLAGADRLRTSYLIADQMKAQMGVEKFDAVIVASGKTFADALPGSYLSAVKHAPIILTLANNKYINQTADYIKANLASGGTVYILGGEKAVPKAMETALAGFKVQRVAGADRFGTNLEILKTAGVKAGDEILVCEAKGYADSLSASATGKPILLVYKKLNDAQKAYLETLSGCKFTVVGGTSAIPENLAKEIKAYGTVTRLAGKDRLETSTMVADKYFEGATSAVVAYGWDFPDGLCGGSLAYAMKAPLILTHSKIKLYTFTADYTIGAGMKLGYVLGGDKLVSNDAASAIFGIKSGIGITVLR